jgi:DNA-binding NarL/FixJ family response regulator
MGTTVVLADDHSATRLGTRLRLEQEPGVRVVAECSDGVEAASTIRELRPDVAVVDMNMPGLDGLEVIAAVGECPTRFVLLTAWSDPVVVQRALDAGAYGFVDKVSPLDVLASAVQVVSQGRRYIDPSLIAGVLDVASDRLSEREVEVLQMAAGGSQNKEIAARLGLSEETVKSHVSNVIRKLGATSRTEAVANALRRALIR